MAERTDAERAEAVDSMFRIRAVESPPDDRGIRTIWHRGLKGAELVSDVDASGRVTRQELWVFEDVVHWDGSLKSGRTPAPESTKSAKAATPTWDAELQQARVDRIAHALKRYSGADRFIRHARDVLGVGEDDGPPLIDAPITRSAPAIREEAAAAEASQRTVARNAKRRERLGLIGIVVGCLATIAGLVMLWRSLGS